MPAPFEIISPPFTAWWAPVGTAFPVIGVAPLVAWTMIGTSGDADYDPAGVTVTHSQEVNLVRPLGRTAPVKAFRTEEGLVISFTVWDVTLEQYRHAISNRNFSTVAAGSGTPGTKTMAFYQGRDVAPVALMLRSGVSPYGDLMGMQYEVPYCFQSGSPEIAYRKGDPAGLDLEFTAMLDPSQTTPWDAFGRLRQQHQPALP